MRPRRSFTAALAGFGVVAGRWRGGALDVNGRTLAGELDADLADGDAAAGIVAPRDVAAAPATGSDPGVELSAVSVQAGVVRLDTVIGLAAELAMEEAIGLGGGALPQAGQRYLLIPQRMRIVGV
ncbi:hypothetical protein ACFOJ6_24155 [Gordonia humi]|uniref:hypothetical protein n=1 Tax=Gordonia humi TaxID=686429 RepID=UPI00362317AE